MNLSPCNSQPAEECFSVPDPRSEIDFRPEIIQGIDKDLDASILIIDDDGTLRKLMATILDSAGFHVVVAENGMAGWNKFQTRPFKLIITDNEMPVLSGIDLLRKVRKTPDSPPCIFASGHVPWDTPGFSSLLQPGIAIEKPFRIAELVKAVNRLVYDHDA